MLEVIKEKKGTNKTDKSNYKDILNKKGKGRWRGKKLEDFQNRQSHKTQKIEDIDNNAMWKAGCGLKEQ